MTDITYYSSARETYFFLRRPFIWSFVGGRSLSYSACIHSIVMTRSCNLFRIIILVSTLHGFCPIVMKNEEMRLRYSMASLVD